MSPEPVPDPSQTIEVSNLYSDRLQCHIYNLRGLQVKLGSGDRWDVADASMFWAILGHRIALACHGHNIMMLCQARQDRKDVVMYRRR